MKFIKHLWKSLTHLSPEEHYPIIMMYGNKQIVIEQVEELISFTNNKISVLSQLGKIEAYGEDLLIVIMQQDEIVIQGTINEVQFSPEERRNV